MALATIAQVKEYLGITGTDDDAFLTNLIVRSEAAIVRYTNVQTLEEAALTIVLNGDGTESLFIPVLPATTLTSISTIDDNGTSTTVTATDYRADVSTGEVFLLGARTGRGRGDRFFPSTFSSGPAEFRFTSPHWPNGFQNISVVGTFGWTTSTIPADLLQAIIEITAIMYRESKRDGTINSESLGDYSYTINDREERDEHVRQLLYPFVRWTL